MFVVVSSFDGPKELWNVVRVKTNSIATQANVHLSNPDIVNNYFAGIATDDCYIKSEVLKFCRSLTWNFQIIWLKHTCIRLEIHLLVTVIYRVV